MSYRIQGWSEGHPHLTKIDGYPFGIAKVTCPYPLLCKKGDGYAASFKRLFDRYKRRAAKQGLEFALTEKTFFEFTSQPCYFCAALPSRKADRKAKNSYIYNGLDRMDSTKGYVNSNCIACCWEHNDLKGKLTYEQFYEQSLAVVLSISSKTALAQGDLECLDRLIELFPNVRFLKEHRSSLLRDMEKKPNDPRFNPSFNWLCKPVQRLAQRATIKQE
jgi:hypothetical protein